MQWNKVFKARHYIDLFSTAKVRPGSCTFRPVRNSIRVDLFFCINVYLSYIELIEEIFCGKWEWFEVSLEVE